MQKPKLLVDVRRHGMRVFSPHKSRINLRVRRVFRIPFLSLSRFAVIAFAFIVFFEGAAIAPTAKFSGAIAAGTSLASDTERQALEAQLKDLETQMDQYENQIVGYQKQGSTLKGEIGKLNTKVSQLNLQIKAVSLKLSELDKTIGETQTKIYTTEDTISSNKEAIGALLAKLYQSDQTGLMQIFLQKPRLSDFFNDVNGIALVRNNLQVALVEVSDLHTQLVEQKNQLALVRADAATIQQYQDAQKKQTEKVKQEKNDLLAKTKGQESKYQTLLKQTKETAAQIRSRIFQLLGGGELSFGEAYKYAKLAGDSTGVRPAFILAVLDRESALGQNVGKCKYNDVSSRTGKVVMSPTRDVPAFLEITSKLNISPDSVTVSCPNQDGTYGGAMGPAQFIPSTWAIYESEIAQITGKSVVSPWNNADAFVATALYMKKLGADGGTLTAEREAAARYYAGSRWKTYLWTYGQAVISRATSFQEDINTLNS